MANELDTLRRKRLEQLRNSFAGQFQRQALEQEAEAEAARQFEAVESAVKARLTKDALQRYGAVKLAHPETANQLVIALAHAIEAGRLRGMLSEEQLVAALRQLSMLSQRGRQQGKIRVIRK